MTSRIQNEKGRAYTIEGTEYYDGVYTYEAYQKLKIPKKARKGIFIKRHPSKKEAKAYYQKQYPNKVIESPHAKKERLLKGRGIYYTDGSFCHQTKIATGGFIRVDPNTGDILYSKIDTFTQKTYKEKGATYAELEAALAALRDASKNGLTNITIYHDAKSVKDWLTKKTPKHQKKEPLLKHYQKISSKHRIGARINFVHVKAHSGNKYNNHIDKLVKKELIEKRLDREAKKQTKKQKK